MADKRQLRAEAVERLKSIKLDPRGGSHEHLSAICGAIYAPSHGWTHGACDGLAVTLIDLLTDDEPCTNNLTWLYSHDEAFAAGVDYAYRYVSGFGVDCGSEREWLMTEHVDDAANQPIGESDASELLEIGEILATKYGLRDFDAGNAGEPCAENDMDAPAEGESPRSGEADSGYHVSFDGLKVTFAPNDGLAPESGVSAYTVDVTTDCGHFADMSQKASDCVRPSSGMSAIDTREKLKADMVRTLKEHGLYWLRACVDEWLDRQAAITEDECLIRSKQGADALYVIENADLQDKVDALQSMLDRYERDYVAPLREQGFEHARGIATALETLTKRVDGLTAERDELHERVVEHAHFSAELCDKNSKLYRRVRELEAMLPSPLAHDGKPIERGETLYGLSDGKAWTVDRIDYGHHHPVMAHSGKAERGLKPEWLVHERPDSWERIARDLRDIDGDSYAHSGTADLSEIAERVEKLAKEGGASCL